MDFEGFREDFVLGGIWKDFGNMLIHVGRICDDFACL